MDPTGDFRLLLELIYLLVCLIALASSTLLLLLGSQARPRDRFYAHALLVYAGAVLVVVQLGRSVVGLWAPSVVAVPLGFPAAAYVMILTACAASAAAVTRRERDDARRARGDADSRSAHSPLDQRPPSV